MRNFSLQLLEKESQIASTYYTRFTAELPIFSTNPNSIFRCYYTTTNKSTKYRFNRWLYLSREEKLSFLVGLIGLVFVSININDFASRTASD